MPYKYLCLVTLYLAVLTGASGYPLVAQTPARIPMNDEAHREERNHQALNKLSYKELKETKNRLVTSGHKEGAIKYLQKMISLSTNVHEIAELMLELADIYFDLGTLVKAQALYDEFTRLYPGNEHAEYTCYKSILCSFYSMLEADRDQTKTRETIKHAEQFLAASTLFKEYRSEVEKILSTCHEQLFTSELSIARFYVSQYRPHAAQTRIAHIEKEFAGKIPHLKPRLLLAQQEFAQWLGDTKLAEECSLKLAQEFPDIEIPERIKKHQRSSTKLAHHEKKRNFTHAF
jgi:outer membrane assembly lipoprotein YfiO